MIQSKKKSDISSADIHPNENTSKNSSNLQINQIESKGKKENDQLSNSITSLGSNKDGYLNFISKLKLNYHLKNPQNRTQTIILHTSLDKSYSDLNESLNQNEINNEQKFDNLFKNNELNNVSNYTGNELDQLLNNGFILDNSVQNNQDGINKKRNSINYLNKLYDEEKKTNNEKGFGVNDNKILSEKVNKDNVTINFNNNMFFLNDSNSNKQKTFPVKNLFNDLKKKNDDSFKDKVFMSNNPFDETYPGIQNQDKNKNNSLPYGFQNNPFCAKNPDKNNNNTSWQQIKLKPSDNNYDNSSLNNLSTNLNTNNTNNNYKDEQNNNKGISPFYDGNNNTSINSYQNFGNSLSELNNNKKGNENNKVGNSNLQFSFNPMNYPMDKGKDNDINYTSNIFPEKTKTICPDNIINNQKYPINQEQEIKNNNDIYEKGPNNNETDNQNSDSKTYIKLKYPYPPELDNDLNTGTFGQGPNIDFNNDKGKDNDNNINPNQNNDPALNVNIPGNSLNNINNDLYNSPNNLDYTIKVNQKDVNLNNEDNNNQEIILNGYENKSLRTSLSSYEESNSELNSKEKSNLLKSLLYGLLLGSTVTGLFWLRNEETRKYWLEKYRNVNFESIVNSFKNFFHPIEFFQKLFSKEKRDVYSKVFGLSLVKFYDFFEKYGDGFRLFGIFLSIYAFWLIIKSLIKAAIKIKNQHK